MPPYLGVRERACTLHKRLRVFDNSQLTCAVPAEASCSAELCRWYPLSLHQRPDVVTPLVRGLQYARHSHRLAGVCRPVRLSPDDTADVSVDTGAHEQSTLPARAQVDARIKSSNRLGPSAPGSKVLLAPVEAQRSVASPRQSTTDRRSSDVRAYDETIDEHDVYINLHISDC